ncbi:hypothetical protein [Ornithinimicrobium cavernae]|uniref:hypothetical protein n=1 Tax=Ornithinimicrobium cavernae TaxID=2666047 RepID=UPI000D68F58D|nr:hypothetical protein [Ornithinimicrobium cavernae]
MTVVTVEELQRAWRAVQAGDFRHHGAPGPRRPARGTATTEWVPEHPVLPVLGCHGGAGTTTLAVALATASDVPARVVEASSLLATGLAGCATAEFGRSGPGWLRGTRDGVLLEHSSDVLATPADAPVPGAAEDAVSLTVLDAGWEAGALFLSDGWLPRAVFAGPGLVLVTTATVPGMRRLEGVLHLLGEDLEPLVAVTGRRRRKWPREVTHAMGDRTRRIDDAEAVVDVPHDAALATSGLDGSPLPAGVLAAATQILRLSEPGLSAQHTPKGQEV